MKNIHYFLVTKKIQPLHHLNSNAVEERDRKNFFLLRDRELLGNVFTITKDENVEFIGICTNNYRISLIYIIKVIVKTYNNVLLRLNEK